MKLKPFKEIIQALLGILLFVLMLGITEGIDTWL